MSLPKTENTRKSSNTQIQCECEKGITVSTAVVEVACHQHARGQHAGARGG